MVFLGREISEQRNYSEQVAQQIDEEIRNIIQHAYEVAKGILIEKKPKLILIAERLIDQETMESQELEALFDETTPKPAPEVIATPMPAEAKAKKTKPVSKKRALVVSPPHPKQAPAALD